MNKRQQLFVVEYLKDFNASRAGRAAGYSEKTAGVQAHELLKNPEIKQAIHDKYVELIGPPEKHVRDVLDTLRHVMENAEKDSDRVSAARWLGQYAKMFSDRIEHTGPEGGPIQVTAVERKIIDPDN